MVMISTPMPIPARKRHSNSPPDEPVGQKAQEKGAGEQSGEGRGDKSADAGETEKGLGGGRQQAALIETGGNIGREKQVVDFETTTERQQDNQAPEMGRDR